MKRFLLALLLLAGMGFLAYQLFLYHQARDTFPVGMTIAGVDVSGHTPDEARELLEERFLRPVIIYHRTERIELDSLEAGFYIDLDAMMAEAQAAYQEENYWEGFLFHVLGWRWQPISIPLQAGYDPEELREMVVTVAEFLDEPGQSPQIVAETAVFRPGEGGFVTDIDASLPLVEKAMISPNNREAELVIVDQDAPELNFELLEAVIRRQLTSFDGMGSIFIMDLETGDEIRINSDVALSGLSILKIGIFAEAFRHIDMPLTDYQEQLFMDTATRSSNYGANLLLHIIAGEDNTYRGADVFTESMWRLGLENTFMAVPYDATAPEHRHTTYTTPANSRTDVNTFPDPSRQTTAEDIGSLLGMIYDCSQGGGTLLAVYPDDLTPEECQYVIDLMVLNEEGNLIRFGVPDEVPVSHKHGWAQATHGDAGIVLSPGGDFVLVEYLHQNGEWLQSSESFPILREIARAVYNYFNYDDPYLGDALVEEHRFDEEEWAEYLRELEMEEQLELEGEGEQDLEGAGASQEEPTATATPSGDATDDPMTNQ
ncbi:MAG TPA: serine hydrolase [Candidatus Sulfomarinibacteraceae bacterium]|nr:serine hydrolase [Candidatus Sulfomarinibacteraceae bacterium]